MSIAEREVAGATRREDWQQAIEVLFADVEVMDCRGMAGRGG